MISERFFSDILPMSPLFVVGVIVLLGFFSGKLANKTVRLPGVIGYMLLGVLFGPSVLNFLTTEIQEIFRFIPKVVLGFIAFSVGTELSVRVLKRQGFGIITVIFSEIFATFILVWVVVYLVTKNIPLAFLLGAIAPASAPGGTIAVIQEYRAKGPLTKTLYSVVGFDDGLGIIVFGFAAAIAKAFFLSEGGSAPMLSLESLLIPAAEIGLALLVGIVGGLFFLLVARRLSRGHDLFAFSFGTIFLITALGEAFHFSLILANMAVGMLAVNALPSNTTEKISRVFMQIMPLNFIFFFVLSGAALDLGALPRLGVLGLLYLLSRTAGLMGGAYLGGRLGKMDRTVCHYLGFGILSQAGVAIGLAMIVKQDFGAMGIRGEDLGSVVVTTIMATSVLFSVFGPAATKFALKRAGEISP